MCIVCILSAKSSTARFPLDCAFVQNEAGNPVTDVSPVSCGARALAGSTHLIVFSSRACPASIAYLPRQKPYIQATPMSCFFSREGRTKCQKPSPAKGQKRKLPEEKQSGAEERGNIDRNKPREPFPNSAWATGRKRNSNIAHSVGRVAWVEVLKSAVLGFESLTLSGSVPQEMAHKSLVITDYSSASHQPPSWPHIIIGCAFVTFSSNMSLQYHQLLSSQFSPMRLCQQCCLCSRVVMQMLELITLKKKYLSVRLFFKLDHSLFQFTVLLAAAQLRREDRPRPNTTA